MQISRTNFQGTDPQNALISNIAKKQYSDQDRDKKWRKWTKEEDEHLLNGIREYGRNWKKISKEYLKSAGYSKRNASSCFDRYRGYWGNLYSVEQISDIAEPIEVTLSKRKKCTRRIVNLFPSSERGDVVKSEMIFGKPYPIDETFFEDQPKIEQTLTSRQKIKFKKWSQEEDQCLLNGIRIFGNNWKRIAEELFVTQERKITRSETSCYDRYRKYWQKFYNIEEILSLKESIRIVALNGNPKKQERRIANLFLSFKQEGDIERASFDKSIPEISSSQMAVSTSYSTNTFKNYNDNQIICSKKSPFIATPFVDPQKVEAFLSIANQEDSLYDFLISQNDIEMTEF